MKLAFKVVAVLLLLEGTLVFSALAGPAEDSAREHTKNASTAFNLGSYDEAAAEYEAAYRAVPDSALLFNIGQSYRLSGKSSKALVAYRSYLRTAPTNASNRAQVESRVRELETGSPGKDQIPVAGPAHPDPPIITVAPYPRQDPVAPADEGIRSAKGRELPSPQGLWLGRTWTWVAGGSAVLFAGAAAVFGVAMQSKFDELDGKCGSASQTFPGCSAGDIRSLDARKNAANVFWGLSAAATLTAGVLLYIEGRPVRVAPVAGSMTGLLAQVRY